MTRSSDLDEVLGTGASTLGTWYTQSSMNELPTTFGKYFLSEKLATGGMAEIYLAKLIGPGGFEKRLIIKQILPQFSGQPEFVDLFVTEAKTLVSLTHGNIVPVYELGVVDGTYFIAMEYIDGPTLEAFTDGVADNDEILEPSTAAFICAEFLKGLDYAHRKGEGVIHRDLSPRNVMISRDGEVKLVDFGIAVVVDQQRDTIEHEPSGPPAGSYPYMSPEQVRRMPLTGQTDLFSAGVLLWEMLTGEQLFRRDTAEATLEAVADAEIVSPASINPKVPPQLDVICLRALQRNEADRFATAVEFSTALNRYLYSREAHETAAKLSKLVARHCPPIVRRAPGEQSEPGSEPRAAAEPGVDHTKPIDRSKPIDGTKPIDRTKPVDRTKPIERAGSATGKRRAKTATFATHVNFEDVLAKATPLFPIQAIDDLEAQIARDREKKEPAEQPPPVTRATAPSSDDEDKAGQTAAMETVPPSSDRLWRNIAIVSVITSISVVAFFMTRGDGRNGTPEQRPDARRVVLTVADAGIIADAAAPAARIDAAPIDAAAVVDARTKVRRKVDARRIIVRRRVDAAVRAPRTFGKLRVGANPWAEVYIGRRKLGRTPNTWTVPVGKHTVLVKFPVPGREQTRRFKVTIRKDAETSLGVIDFTKPQ